MEQDNVSNVFADATSNANVGDTTVNNDDENLFAGLTPTEETNEVADEPKNEEPTTVEAPVKEEKPFSLDISYRDEKRTLNEEEARMYAQKGMNYDHIFEPLHKLAKLNGMKVEEYLNKLFDTETDLSIGEQMNSLKQQYPETPDEVLRELAEKRVRENQNLQMQKFEDESNNQKKALSAEVERQVGIFNREYPDLDPGRLDKEVYKYVEQGYSLLEAYNKWSKIQDEKNRPALEAKEKSNKLNEENKRKSLGNITNTGDESSEYNDFFKGMDSI